MRDFVIHKLCLLHKEQQKQLHETSSLIYQLLQQRYTEDKIKQFKDVNEFLDEVNEICESDCYSKLLFIKQTIEKYFK